MRYHALIPLLAAISCLALAILVRRAASRSTTRSAFIFLAVVLFFWNLNFFVLYFFTDYDIALTLSSFFRVAAIVLPPAVLRLSVALRADRKPGFAQYALWGSYIAAVLLAIENVRG